MQMNDVDPSTLRRLAELKAEQGTGPEPVPEPRPTDFATPKARASAVRSLLDEASRRVREADGGLSHEDKVGLKRDLERMEQFFNGTATRAGRTGSRSSPAPPSTCSRPQAAAARCRTRW